MNKQRIFIDAMPIVESRMSGVGHLTLEMIQALSKDESIELILVVTLRKKKHLARHSIKAKAKQLPIPAKVLSALLRMGLCPPLDLYLGRGTYIFPNYRNWPLFRSKSITYFHDAVFMLYPETVQPKNLAYLLKYSKTWLRRADIVATLSNSSKEDLIKLFPAMASKVRVVTCGVNHQVFYPHKKDEIHAAQQKYDLPQKYILYVGNFEPRKNLTTLVDAYRSLPRKLSDEYSLLLIGGDGWLNDELSQKIEESRMEGLNIIKPSKYISNEDLPAVFSGATLLVHPAKYEGFGLSPLQAMASGVPVITGNNSSLPEVVGNAGILVNESDSDEMAQQIAKVLTSQTEQSKLSKMGIERAQSFTWEASAKELVSLARELE